MTLKEQIALRNNKQTMWTLEGAKFQEVAINMLDAKGSEAHKNIGKLVTMINNSQISYADAIAQYVSLLK